MQKIKKGDSVAVISGKDKGREGLVDRVFVNEHKVMIAGVNKYKKHNKLPTGSGGSGIVEIGKPIDIAKVMLICPSCHKKVRVGFALRNDEKVRICKSCKKVVK